MRRIVTGAAVWVAVLGLVSACGGQSPYCTAVKDDKALLDSFGATRTDAAFASYAKALRSVAAEAPSNSKADWKRLAEVTEGVIAAHQDVGFKLDDMKDAKKREGLGTSDIAELNKAYAAFNDTAKQRKAIIADAEQTCDIKLK